MNVMQMSVDTLERARERFYETLDQMSVEEANTMPHPLIKSVTWLLWHDALMMDEQVSVLMGVDSLWVSKGWRERFSLDLPKDSDGWNHTPEQAQKVVVSNKQLLKDYYDAAHERICSYLLGLDEASLADIVDRSWDPPVTRQVRLVSIVDDAAMHSGQAVYTRRLVIGR